MLESINSRSMHRLQTKYISLFSVDLVQPTSSYFHTKLEHLSCPESVGYCFGPPHGEVSWHGGVFD